MNDQSMDDDLESTIDHLSINERYSHKMNEQSVDDDLESIDHLSINERTIGTRSKKFW